MTTRLVGCMCAYHCWLVHRKLARDGINRSMHSLHISCHLFRVCVHFLLFEMRELSDFKLQLYNGEMNRRLDVARS